MNNSFLDSLRRHQPIFDAIGTVCRTEKMPIFVDLCWGDSFDAQAAFHDSGIQFDLRERRLVLMRINDEIRYYVGPKDPSANDQPQEIGVLPTEARALSFAYEYLVKHIPLSQIKVERNVRSKSPESMNESVATLNRGERPA